MKRRFIGLSVSVLLMVSCAGIMNTMQSTLEREVDRAPYYVDLKKEVSVPADSVYFLPVTVSQGKHFFSPNLKPLHQVVNESLRSLARDKWLDYAITGQQQPQVLFGVDDFFEEDDDEEDDPPLVFQISQPSKNWLATWDPPKNGFYLSVELNISAYKVRQKNWKGSKEVEMGTGYKVPVPWLTSLDDPVPVVQLAGMLLDKNGKLLRAGAEGIYVKRTAFGFSLLGISEIITDEDIQKIIQSHQRDDLEGRPLAFKAALNHLIEGLLQ